MTDTRATFADQSRASHAKGASKAPRGQANVPRRGRPWKILPALQPALGQSDVASARDCRIGDRRTKGRPDPFDQVAPAAIVAISRTTSIRCLAFEAHHRRNTEQATG